MKINGIKRSLCLMVLLIWAMASCSIAQAEVMHAAGHEVNPAAAAARLAGKNYELTIDQVYCDGRKLYYSYVLTTAEQSIEPLEGEKMDLCAMG